MLIEDINKKRFRILVEAGCLTESESKKFLELETILNNPKKDKDWLSSFHCSNDSYRPLLEKVLKGLTFIEEPHSKEKYKEYMEELGTMSPAVFLTPWTMTLNYLDTNVGNIEEIKKFYFI